MNETSVNMGTSFDGNGFLCHIAFNMTRALQNCRFSKDVAFNGPSHSDCGGRDRTSQLAAFTKDKAAATNISINAAIKLQFTCGGDVARDVNISGYNRQASGA